MPERVEPVPLDAQAATTRHRHAPREQSLEDIELALLLEGVYRHYGFDFREYSRASLRRRREVSLRRFMRRCRVNT